MDDKFRMRLYALTCVVCIAWLAQSISSDLNDARWLPCQALF